MKLSELRQLLRTHGIRPSRALGQNFLHDANLVRKILETAEVRFGDRILEIGPGLGALTRPMLDRGAQVRAIEKDRRLAEILQTKLQGRPGWELVVEDAVRYLRSHRQEDWSGWKCVSNLPYSAGSSMLVELAFLSRPPWTLTVTVQKEVAARLMAPPGTPDYGLLTVLVQIRYEPQAHFPVPRTCFYPVPEVESTCLHLVRRPEPLLPAPELPAFARFVKTCFSERRKQLGTLLRRRFPRVPWPDLLEKLEIPSQIRAEALPISAFVRLYSAIASQGGLRHDPSQ